MLSICNDSVFPVTSDECKHGGVLNNADLEGGEEANNFTVADGVRTMKQCIRRCCAANTCDLAIFKNGQCYTVNCEKEDSCQISHSADSATQIAFIFTRPANKQRML